MQVVDARSEGRFNGTAPEPRPSFPSGHMIGAKNVPFMRLINSESKLVRSKEELRGGRAGGRREGMVMQLLCVLM